MFHHKDLHGLSDAIAHRRLIIHIFLDTICTLKVAYVFDYVGELMESLIRGPFSLKIFRAVCYLDDNLLSASRRSWETRV